MAQEPDNLVLQMLREIRSQLTEQRELLAEHSRFHEEHRQAFSDIREELRQANQNAIYAMGLSTLFQRDGEATKERVTALETKVRKLEDRVDRL